jgi:hypothetical protein
MTITYKEVEIAELNTKWIERTNEDGSVSVIPIDPANSDYQRYLNPEAEQSTPLTNAVEKDVV